VTRSPVLAPSVFTALFFVISATSFPVHAQLSDGMNQAAAHTEDQSQLPATHKIVKFDVPGAGTSSGQGTMPIGIVADGSILGWYIDSSTVYHGFLRSPAGGLTEFDAPGAGTGSGQGTFPSGINSALAIVGFYADANGAFHGFLRSPGGTFTTLDAPGAGTGAFQGTQGENINSKSEIAGDYIDSNSVFHGLLRSPGGDYTTYDAPGAGTGAGQGTFPSALSGLTDTEATTGNCVDANNVYHGFLRSADGSFATFDPPGSVQTLVVGLSSNETVAGEYIDSTGLHAFLRTTDGTITSYDVSNSNFTGANNIDAEGAITGAYFDSNNVSHGYMRAPDGTVAVFNVPGAGTGQDQGTSANDINSTGQITGDYVDSSGVNHGFVLK
jgi:hypothetical protein